MQGLNPKFLVFSAAAAVSLLCSGCGPVSNYFNPFYEPPSEIALQGQPNDHALNEGQKEDTARKALEAWGTYKRQSPPQPNAPVVRPAIVRLLWVPDHLNSHGDLVPAHYYYLKVLKDRWEVEDAFEDAREVGDSAAGGNANYSYVWEGKKKAVTPRSVK